MSNVTVTKNTYTVEPLYQWDLNQVLTIYGLSLASIPEIHFSNMAMDRAIVRQASMDAAGVITVDVPNSLLQKPYTIAVYVCTYSGSTFETQYKLEIPVKARTKPADYTLEDDDEVYSFNALENQVVNALAVVSAAQTATAADAATASASAASAKTAATNAAASQAAAKTSETNAAASQTAAKTSETNAANSEEAAAASAETATGAKEAAVAAQETVTSLLTAVSNPNLLDNWYFADPIDQRNGYVVLAGTEVYSDSGLTDLLATLTTAEKILGTPTVTDSYAQYTSYAGNTRYTKVSQAPVRGYVGAGYTIDRWKLGSGGVVLIEEGYIYFDPLDGVARNFEQMSEVLLDTGMYTYSALLENAEGANLVIGVNGGWVYVTCPNDEKRLIHHTFYVSGRQTVGFYLQSTKGINIYSAKLELGSVQTLAHQDSTGAWVLNDPPPNKALELAKCQRYQVVYAPSAALTLAASAITRNSTAPNFALVLPTSLRNAPSVSFSNLLIRNTHDGTTQEVVSVSLGAVSNNIVILGAKVTTATNADEDYSLRVLAGGNLILDANL